jgi:hypothetical protein
MITPDKIAELMHVASKLSTEDRKFADSLTASFMKYGKLTSAQEPWVQKLIDRANGKKGFDHAAAAKVGDFSGVVALFKTVGSKLKYPKIRLQLSNGQPIALALMGPGSKWPGSVNISDGGSYGANQYYGRVLADGTWMQSKTTAEEEKMFRVQLLSLLEALAKDPAGVAAAYGKKTGNCCFCHSALTDQKSTDVGYGPVCAKHYDLPWGVKTTSPLAGLLMPLEGVLAGKTLRSEPSAPAAFVEPGSADKDEETIELIKDRPSRKFVGELVPGQACQQLMEFMHG